MCPPNEPHLPTVGWQTKWTDSNRQSSGEQRTTNRYSREVHIAQTNTSGNSDITNAGSENICVQRTDLGNAGVGATAGNLEDEVCEGDRVELVNATWHTRLWANSQDLLSNPCSEHTFKGKPSSPVSTQFWRNKNH
jgi:hypothetical protein